MADDIKIKNKSFSELHEIDIMERVGIGQNGLALLLLALSERIAADQLIDDLIGLRQLASLDQLHSLLDQHLLGHFLGKHLLQVLQNGHQKLPCLAVVGPNRRCDRSRSTGGDYHAVQISRAVSERTFNVVAAVTFHEVLGGGRGTLQSWVL